MKYAFSRSLCIVVLALAAAIAGCGNDDVLAPQFEPEVTNLQDSFAFQATDITGVSQVLTYSWENTGVSANVDQSSSIGDGSASISVRDAQGVVMYSGNLSEDGSFQTQEGDAGTWTIRISLSSLEGTLNFRLQKRT